jgi:hypothetical protein
MGDIQSSGLLVYMQQGIRSRIIEPLRIREMADTDTVHDNQDDTIYHRQIRSSLYLLYFLGWMKRNSIIMQAARKEPKNYQKLIALF